MTDLIPRQAVLDAIMKWRLESGPISTAIYDVVKDMPRASLTAKDAEIARLEKRDTEWRALVAVLVAEAERNAGGSMLETLHNAALQAARALHENPESKA